MVCGKYLRAGRIRSCGCLRTENARVAVAVSKERGTYPGRAPAVPLLAQLWKEATCGK